MSDFLLSKVLRKLKKLKKQLKEIPIKMDQDKATIIAAFDAATTAIGDRIAALIASQTNALDPEFKAALESEIAKLNGLGSGGSAPTV